MVAGCRTARSTAAPRSPGEVGISQGYPHTPFLNYTVNNTSQPQSVCWPCRFGTSSQPQRKGSSTAGHGRRCSRDLVETERVNRTRCQPCVRPLHAPRRQVGVLTLDRGPPFHPWCQKTHLVAPIVWGYPGIQHRAQTLAFWKSSWTVANSQRNSKLGEKRQRRLGSPKSSKKRAESLPVLSPPMSKIISKAKDGKHTSEAKNLHHPGRVSWAPVQLCCRYSRWHRAPARPAGQIGVSWSLASLQEPRTTPRTGPIAEGSCKHYKSISNTCRKNSPDWTTPQLPTKWNVARLGPSATCLSFYSHHHVLPESLLYPCLLPSLALAAVT